MHIGNNSYCNNLLDSNSRLMIEAGIGVSNRLKYSNELFLKKGTLTNWIVEANLVIRHNPENLNPFYVNLNSAHSNFSNDSLELAFRHFSTGIKLSYNLKPVTKVDNFELCIGFSFINTRTIVSKKSLVSQINNSANPLNLYSTNKLVSTNTYFIPIEFSYIHYRLPNYYKFSLFYNFAFRDNNVKNLTKIGYSTFGFIFRVPIATIIS